MTYRGFHTRADLGLRAPRSRSFNITPQHGGVTGHWSGPDQNIALILSGHTRCRYLWKQFQNYHMDTHGWSDLAYTGGVCQHGYAFAGRGAGVRTAANGTNSGNQNWYAICWIGGQGETPTKDALDAFWWFVQSLRNDGNAGQGINEHADHKATSCAGTFGDAIKGSTPTDPIPTDPTDPEDNEMLKKGDEGTAVTAYQKRIDQWATQAGRLSGKSADKDGDVWERWLYWGTDGDFGSTTEDAVQEFQKAYDLPATGQIGGVTAGLLAMYAVNAGGGGGDHTHTHNHDGRYARKGHTHDASDHAHNALYVTKAVYDAHRHDEGRTSTPQ